MQCLETQPRSQPIAVVFPGQGAQRPGMGRDFYEAFDTARRAFEEGSDGAGLDLAAICFGADAERLGLTEFAQPAILVVEIAMVRVLAEAFGLGAQVYGGHSLGEYAALVAAGVLPLAAAAATVRERGRLMQGATPVGVGRMVAIIADGIDTMAIEGACADLCVDVANNNSADQVVISGATDDVKKAEAVIADALAERAPRMVALDVSAPFHSRLMQPVEDAFTDVLAGLTDLHTDCADTVTSNYTGSFHENDAECVRSNLLKQICGTVRWRDNMQALASRSERVIEVGPGRPLRGFFKSMGMEAKAITDLRTAERAFAHAG